MTDDAPGITAVIPVYNGLAHIERAVESIVNQTVPVLEILLIDDASTDGSAKLIDEIAARANPVSVRALHQAHAGQSAARNYGVAQARGELIAFLDQDDQWLPAHVADLAPHFAPDPTVGLVFGDFDEIDGDGHLVTRGFIQTHGVRHPRNSIVDWIASDTMVVPTAAMVRKDALLQVGGFDPLLTGYEDDDLWIRMFRDGWNCVFVENSVSTFRVHGGSSSTNASFRESRVRFFHKISQMLPDDVARSRYYVGDVLRPRLVSSAMAEFSAALRMDRLDEARATLATVDDMLGSSGKKVVRSHERWALGGAGRMRWARRVNRVLPRRKEWLSRRINAALERRD